MKEEERIRNLGVEAKKQGRKQKEEERGGEVSEGNPRLQNTKMVTTNLKEICREGQSCKPSLKRKTKRELEAQKFTRKPLQARNADGKGGFFI